MIALQLPFPPSVNTYYRHYRGRAVLSAAGRKFKQTVAEILAEKNNRIEGRLNVFMRLFAPTRRAYDIDNRIKAVFDALQDGGLFDDDEQIDRIEVVRGPIIKGGACYVVVTHDAS